MSAGRSSTGENERVQAIAALPPPGPTHLEAVNPSKHTPDAPRLSTGTKPSSHSASVCVRAHVLNTHFALTGCAYPAPSACLFPSLCVCVRTRRLCVVLVWFLAAVCSPALHWASSNPAETATLLPRGRAAGPWPSARPSSPQKHLLCLFLFSLLTLPLTLLLSSLFSCALYPFFCCILQGQLYLPRCLSPGLWLLNNRLRSSPLSVDYFADLQGRSDDDPGLYWEFYGSAVCGEYWSALCVCPLVLTKSLFLNIISVCTSHWPLLGKAALW